MKKLLLTLSLLFISFLSYASDKNPLTQKQVNKYDTVYGFVEIYIVDMVEKSIEKPIYPSMAIYKEYKDGSKEIDNLYIVKPDENGQFNYYQLSYNKFNHFISFDDVYQK